MKRMQCIRAQLAARCRHGSAARRVHRTVHLPQRRAQHHGQDQHSRQPVTAPVAQRHTPLSLRCAVAM